MSNKNNFNMTEFKNFLTLFMKPQIEAAASSNIFEGTITMVSANYCTVEILDGTNVNSIAAKKISANESYKAKDSVYILQTETVQGEEKNISYWIIGKANDLIDKYQGSTPIERFQTHTKVNEEDTVVQADVYIESESISMPIVLAPENEEDINMIFFFEGLRLGRALYFEAKITAPEGATRETEYGFKFSLYAGNVLIAESVFSNQYFEGIPEFLDNSKQIIVFDYKNDLNIDADKWKEIDKLTIDHLTDETGSLSNVIIKSGQVILDASQLAVTINPTDGAQGYFTPAKGGIAAVNSISMTASVTYKDSPVAWDDLEYIWEKYEDGVWKNINEEEIITVFGEQGNTETKTVRVSSSPVLLQENIFNNYSTKIRCRVVYGWLEAESNEYTIYNYNKLQNAVTTVVTSNSASNLLLADQEQITLTAKITNQNTFASIAERGFRWYYSVNGKDFNIIETSDISNDQEYRGAKLTVKMNSSINSIMWDAVNKILSLPKESAVYEFYCESLWLIINDATGSEYNDPSNHINIESKVSDDDIELVSRNYYKYFISPSMSVNFTEYTSQSEYLPSQDTYIDNTKTYYYYDNNRWQEKAFTNIENGNPSTDSNCYEKYVLDSIWSIVEPQYEEIAINEDNFDSSQKQGLYYQNDLGNYILVSSSDSYVEGKTYYENVGKKGSWTLVDKTKEDEEKWDFIRNDLSTITNGLDPLKFYYIYYIKSTIWSERNTIKGIESFLKQDGWTQPTIIRQIKQDSSGQWINSIEGAAADKVNTFRELTNNGTTEGCFYTEDEDPKLYINATYLKTGAIEVSDKNGNGIVFRADIDTNDVSIGGFTVDSNSIKSKGPEVFIGSVEVNDTEKDYEIVMATNYFKVADGILFEKVGDNWRGSLGGGLTIGGTGPEGQPEYTLAEIYSRQLWVLYTLENSPINPIGITFTIVNEVNFNQSVYGYAQKNNSGQFIKKLAETDIDVNKPIYRYELNNNSNIASDFVSDEKNIIWKPISDFENQQPLYSTQKVAIDKVNNGDGEWSDPIYIGPSVNYILECDDDSIFIPTQSGSDIVDVNALTHNIAIWAKQGNEKLNLSFFKNEEQYSVGEYVLQDISDNTSSYYAKPNYIGTNSENLILALQINEESEQLSEFQSYSYAFSLHQIVALDTYGKPTFGDELSRITIQLVKAKTGAAGKLRKLWTSSSTLTYHTNYAGSSPFYEGLNFGLKEFTNNGSNYIGKEEADNFIFKAEFLTATNRGVWKTIYFTPNGDKNDVPDSLKPTDGSEIEARSFDDTLRLQCTIDPFNDFKVNNIYNQASFYSGIRLIAYQKSLTNYIECENEVVNIVADGYNGQEGKSVYKIDLEDDYYTIEVNPETKKETLTTDVLIPIRLYYGPTIVTDTNPDHWQITPDSDKVTVNFDDGGNIVISPDSNNSSITFELPHTQNYVVAYKPDGNNIVATDTLKIQWIAGAAWGVQVETDIKNGIKRTYNINGFSYSPNQLVLNYGYYQNNSFILVPSTSKITYSYKIGEREVTLDQNTAQARIDLADYMSDGITSLNVECFIKENGEQIGYDQLDWLILDDIPSVKIDFNDDYINVGVTKENYLLESNFSSQVEARLWRNDSLISWQEKTDDKTYGYELVSNKSKSQYTVGKQNLGNVLKITFSPQSDVKQIEEESFILRYYERSEKVAEDVITLMPSINGSYGVKIKNLPNHSICRINREDGSISYIPSLLELEVGKYIGGEWFATDEFNNKTLKYKYNIDNGNDIDDTVDLLIENGIVKLDISTLSIENTLYLKDLIVDVEEEQIVLETLIDMLVLSDGQDGKPADPVYRLDIGNDYNQITVDAVLKKPTTNFEVEVFVYENSKLLTNISAADIVIGNSNYYTLTYDSSKSVITAVANDEASFDEIDNLPMTESIIVKYKDLAMDILKIQYVAGPSYSMQSLTTLKNGIKRYWDKEGVYYNPNTVTFQLHKYENGVFIPVSELPDQNQPLTYFIDDSKTGISINTTTVDISLDDIAEDAESIMISFYLGVQLIDQIDYLIFNETPATYAIDFVNDHVKVPCLRDGNGNYKVNMILNLQANLYKNGAAWNWDQEYTGENLYGWKIIYPNDSIIATPQFVGSNISISANKWYSSITFLQNIPLKDDMLPKEIWELQYYERGQLITSDFVTVEFVDDAAYEVHIMNLSENRIKKDPLRYTPDELVFDFGYYHTDGRWISIPALGVSNPSIGRIIIDDETIYENVALNKPTFDSPTQNIYLNIAQYAPNSRIVFENIKANDILFAEYLDIIVVSNGKDGNLAYYIDLADDYHQVSIDTKTKKINSNAKIATPLYLYGGGQMLRPDETMVADFTITESNHYDFEIIYEEGKDYLTFSGEPKSDPFNDLENLPSQETITITYSNLAVDLLKIQYVPGPAYTFRPEVDLRNGIKRYRDIDENCYYLPDTLKFNLGVLINNNFNKINSLPDDWTSIKIKNDYYQEEFTDVNSIEITIEDYIDNSDGSLTLTFEAILDDSTSTTLEIDILDYLIVEDTSAAYTLDIQNDSISVIASEQGNQLTASITGQVSTLILRKGSEIIPLTDWKSLSQLQENGEKGYTIDISVEGGQVYALTNSSGTVPMPEMIYPYAGSNDGQKQWFIKNDETDGLTINWNMVIFTNGASQVTINIAVHLFDGEMQNLMLATNSITMIKALQGSKGDEGSTPIVIPNPNSLKYSKEEGSLINFSGLTATAQWVNTNKIEKITDDDAKVIATVGIESYELEYDSNTAQWILNESDFSDFQTAIRDSGYMPFTVSLIDNLENLLDVETIEVYADGKDGTTPDIDIADIGSPDIIEDYVFYAFTNSATSMPAPLTVTVERQENSDDTITIDLGSSWHYPRSAFLTSKEGTFNGIKDIGGYDYIDPPDDNSYWTPWTGTDSDKYVWKTQIQVYKYYTDEGSVSGRRNVAVSQPILMTTAEAYQAAANEVIKNDVYFATEYEISDYDNGYHNPLELCSGYGLPSLVTGSFIFSTDKGKTVKEVNVPVEAGNVSRWCYLYNHTLIDGGSILTGSIEADQIAANAITVEKIDSKAVTAEKINVTDLQAIGATIGGWSLSETAISKDLVGMTAADGPLVPSKTLTLDQSSTDSNDIREGDLGIPRFYAGASDNNTGFYNFTVTDSGAVIAKRIFVCNGKDDAGEDKFVEISSANPISKYLKLSDDQLDTLAIKIVDQTGIASKVADELKTYFSPAATVVFEKNN